MNILQLLPSLDVGGVETGTVDLARYLVRNGHRAIVISNGGRLVRDLEEAGARHYELPVHRKDFFSVLRMISEVERIIRREDIDVVHARSRVPSWIGYFASRRAARAFVTTAHGYYSKHFFSSVMGWGKIVIVASTIIARHMVQDFGVPYGRVRLVPRGVDLDRFPLVKRRTRQDGSFVVGIVARITPLKGHADLLKAAAILSREIPHLKVLIAGDAPKSKARYLEELELLARRLGLERIVEFTGTQADVPSFLKELDLLVSATVTQEAFGRSIIEAQASGIPVVATRVGGVVDIIDDGVTGLLCNASDSRGMASAILRLYRDRVFADDLVRNARNAVEERYTLTQMAKRTVAVYEEVTRQKKILVIKLSSLGDCILCIPSLRALREKFKEARITVLTGLASRDVFNNCPYIDEKIVFAPPEGGWFWPALSLGRALRREQFDMVVDFQNTKMSHLVAFASMAPERYGYDNDKWSFFLNRTVRDTKEPIGPVAHQARTLRLLGIEHVEKRLELFPSTEDAAKADELLAANWVKEAQVLVGIHLKASSRWLTKNWPLEHIARLSDLLAAENVRVVITGGPSDIDDARELQKLTHAKPVVAVGKTTVLELAALMRRFGCFVTPDSSPLHIATAMGVPVIALFGPTDPRRHFVESPRSVVIRKELRCSPCYDPHCTKSFRCMRTISVEEVLAAIREIISLPAFRGHAVAGGQES